MQLCWKAQPAKALISVSLRHFASFCKSGRRQDKLIKLALRGLLARNTKLTKTYNSSFHKNPGNP